MCFAAPCDVMCFATPCDVMCFAAPCDVICFAVHLVMSCVLLHLVMSYYRDRIITVQFMRKYLNIAKKIVPALTREAADFISEEYSKLRNQENLQGDLARTQPITARNLETMIRLATAHAKARLSKKVLLEDAEAAVELVQFACFKRVS